jgi:hypothetical protein
MTLQSLSSHILRSANAVELGLGGLRVRRWMSWRRTTMDLYNFFARYKKERIKGRDATSVINYIKVITEKDTESFFSSTTLKVVLKF